MSYGKTFRAAKDHFKKHGHKYASAAKGLYHVSKTAHSVWKGHKKSVKSKGIEQTSAGLHPQDIGGITSYNRHRLGPKHTPKFEKMSGPCNIQIDGSLNNGVTTGQQTFVDFPTAWVQGSGTSGNWTGDLGYVTRASNTQRTTQFGGSAAATSVNFKTFLSYGQQTVFYSNAAVHPVILTLYDYVCIEDTTLSAVNAMGNSVVADGLNSLGTSASAAITNPGYKPTDSSTFRQCYRITRTKQMVLNGGECHQHKVKITYNKMIDESRINELLLATSNTAYLKGWTTGTLARVHYFPAVGVTSGQDLADGVICSYTMNKYYYRITGSTATHNEISNTYVVPAVGNQKYVDEMAGQVILEATGFVTGAGHA